jgi:hypothetical protein
MLNRPLSSRTSFMVYGVMWAPLLGRMDAWGIVAFFLVVGVIETWMCRDKGAGQ